MTLVETMGTSEGLLIAVPYFVVTALCLVSHVFVPLSLCYHNDFYTNATAPIPITAKDSLIARMVKRFNIVGD